MMKIFDPSHQEIIMTLQGPILDFDYHPQTQRLIVIEENINFIVHVFSLENKNI
jgi:hypothetical protein